MAERRKRQVIVRADKTILRPADPPRADVLFYPGSELTSVLVRRTHDVDLARGMAEERWAELDVDELLVDVRVGWWRTVHARTIPPRSAVDHLKRVVTWTDDDRAPGAGPGVEFRPAYPKEKCSG